MRSHAEKVAFSSILICVALMLSYLETLLPYIPIPGFKPGIANIAITVALFRLGLPSAVFVSISRILLSTLLFSSPSTLIFSLSGGICSLCVLAIYILLLNRFIGLIGLGVLSSTAHCIGQSLAASLLYGTSILFTYLPWILLLAIPTGILTGTLSYLILVKIKKLRLGVTKGQ